MMMMSMEALKRKGKGKRMMRKRMMSKRKRMIRKRKSWSTCARGEIQMA